MRPIVMHPAKGNTLIWIGRISSLGSVAWLMHVQRSPAADKLRTAPSMVDTPLISFEDDLNTSSSGRELAFCFDAHPFERSAFHWFIRSF